MEDYFLIAQVTSVFNDKGYVKIKSYSDFPGRFNKLNKVYIEFFGNKKVFIVDNVRQVNGSILLKFRNFNSAADAENIVGKNIYVPESEVEKLQSDEYYIHDLIGTKIYRNDAFFGTLIDVMQLPANDVYVIIDSKGDEVLIPALKELIISFDPNKKEMILKPGNGFYEEDED